MKSNRLIPRSKNVKLKWWQIALLSFAVSALGGLSSMRPHKKERKLYDKDLKQAPWAPPGWLYGPAWTINNYFLILALQKVMHSNLPERKKLLVLQAFIWVIFFSFGYVYFNKKSPVLAALWTISDAALATTSFVIAYKMNKKLSYLYLPLAGWTTFASTIAIYQALENADPVLNTDALLD